MRKPTRGKLLWDDSAVAAVYELTNGHPYYTNLICAAAFTTAVSERDAVLTDSDVLTASKHLAATTPGNAFAHLWKDGISDADRQRAEVFELNRRRILCASARALRRITL